MEREAGRQTHGWYYKVKWKDFDTYEFRRWHVQIQIAQGNFVATLCTGHQSQCNIETLQIQKEEDV